jgi:hypothetical protein
MTFRSALGALVPHPTKEVQAKNIGKWLGSPQFNMLQLDIATYPTYNIL